MQSAGRELTMARTKLTARKSTGLSTKAGKTLAGPRRKASQPMSLSQKQAMVSQKKRRKMPGVPALKCGSQIFVKWT